MVFWFILKKSRSFFLLIRALPFFSLKMTGFLPSAIAPRENVVCFSHLYLPQSRSYHFPFFALLLSFVRSWPFSEGG